MINPLALDPTNQAERTYSEGNDDPFAFSIVPGSVVRDILTSDYPLLVDVVQAAYVAHSEGASQNPPSHFLRFKDRPRDRIIALPADLGPDAGLAGIKWIASWPENVGRGIPRASALLILNRRDTGYPFCVMEASIVSAARTAASATLGLERLGNGRLPRNPRIGFVGCGLIARYILDMIIARGCQPSAVAAFDLNISDSQRLLTHVPQYAAAGPATSIEALIRDSEVIVFATTAASPHVTNSHWFAHAPVVINVSLRDLAPEVILASDNIVDDVDHCLQADTSPHLAEQMTGRRDFITGTIAGVASGTVQLDTTRAVIFSPFGMGILDLAVGQYVFTRAKQAGSLLNIPDFFVETTRW